MQLSAVDQRFDRCQKTYPINTSRPCAHCVDGYEDGITIGGVFCGKDIGNGLLAEEITERRFVIRQRIETNYARRAGEVCGGDQFGGGKNYQATKPNGDHVAIRKSLRSAAKTLMQL